MHFTKFSKISKNYITGPIFQNATWECLGLTSGAPQGCTPCAGAASKGGAPPCGEGPSWPHSVIPSTHSTLSPEKTRTSLFSLAFSPESSGFLDLLAQLRFLSEIWHICSPVCDSSAHPSRILFGGVYLEYFAILGDRLCELACLIYALRSSFDACLAFLLFVIVILPCLFVLK